MRINQRYLMTISISSLGISYSQITAPFGNAGRDKVARDFTMETCSRLFEQEFERLEGIM